MGLFGKILNFILQVKNSGIASKITVGGRNNGNHILSMLVDIFNELDLSKSHYQFSDDSRATVINNCNDQGAIQSWVNTGRSPGHQVERSNSV